MRGYETTQLRTYEFRKSMIKKSKQLIKESWNLVCDKAGCRYEDYYHPEKPYSRLHRWVDAAMLVFLIVLLGIVGYVLVQLYGFADQKRLDISVRVSPTSLESGGEAHVDVMFDNISEQTLYDASLVLRPQSVLSNLQVDHGSYDYEKNTLLLGTIEPGANGHVSFIGDVLTSIVQPQSMHFVMNYNVHPDDTVKQQEYFAAELIADSSVLDIDVEIPDVLAAGQTENFVIEYVNHSEERTFTNIKISSFIPDGLLPNTQNQEHVIELLAPGESGELVFPIVFDTTESEIPVSFELSVVADDVSLLQDVVVHTIEVQQPQLEVIHNVDAAIYQPGSFVNFLLSYTNAEEFPVDDLTVLLELDPRIWDFQSIVSDSGQIMDNGFLWNAGDVAVGSSAELTVPVRLRGTQTRSVVYSPTNAVVSRVSAQYPHPEYENVAFNARGNDIAKRVSTDLRVSGIARFFTNEGDQVGRGAYPPTVGQQSRYWVVLRPQNNINAVEDVVVTANVSNSVRCTGAQSLCEGSNMDYDPIAGTLTWYLGLLDPVQPRNLGGAFEVAFTPNSNQRGSQITLLSNIKITGRDSLTGQTLTYTAPNVIVPDVVQ